jgi:MtN3 and saliva related transmembrane protein
MYDFIQLFGGIILTSGYLPQIMKIYKTKDATAISIPFYCLLVFGICLYEIYAVHLFINQNIYAFLVTNTMSLISSIIILLMVVFYNKK